MNFERIERIKQELMFELGEMERSNTPMPDNITLKKLDVHDLSLQIVDGIILGAMFEMLRAPHTNKYGDIGFYRLEIRLEQTIGYSEESLGSVDDEAILHRCQTIVPCYMVILNQYQFNAPIASLALLKAYRASVGDQ